MGGELFLMNYYYPKYTTSHYIQNGHIQCKIDTVPPTHRIYHTHEYYEIEFAISGQGENIIDGKPYPVKPGVVSFLSPLNLHSVCGSDDCRYVAIAFSESACSERLLSQLNFEDSTIVLELDESDFNFIKTTTHELMSNPDDKSFAELLLTSIITKLAKKHTNSTHINKTISNTERAIFYLINNFKKDISLKDIADHVGLSTFYLSAQFKKETGISFTEYRDKLRFNRAQNLLELTDMSIKQICFESGFSNYENFIRRFTTHFGTSPQRYRKNQNLIK